MEKFPPTLHDVVFATPASEGRVTAAWVQPMLGMKRNTETHAFSIDCSASEELWGDVYDNLAERMEERPGVRLRVRRYDAEGKKVAEKLVAHLPPFAPPAPSLRVQRKAVPQSDVDIKRLRRLLDAKSNEIADLRSKLDESELRRRRAERRLRQERRQFEVGDAHVAEELEKLVEALGGAPLWPRS